MIVFAAIAPHPPVSIPGIGELGDKAKLRQTLQAFDQLRVELERTKPDTIVIISPHCKLEELAFTVNTQTPLRGSFAAFGLDLVLEFENDVEITDKIGFVGQMRELPVHFHGGFLDHGALVPLFHLAKNIEPKLVHLSFSLLDFTTHYKYGEMIGRICALNSKRVAIIASGDLSHRLTPDAPAGYYPGAQFFDQRLIGILSTQDFPAILSLQQDGINAAAECGLRSFVILLGAIANQEKNFQLLSYEHPFGIGHLVARLV